MEFTFDHKELDSVVKRYNIKFVILHGSYATDTFRSDSDIDIAIFGNEKISSAEFIKCFEACEKIFCDNGNRELDLKTLHDVDPFFRYEVIKHGKLLYGDSVEYENYKAYSFRAYEDAKPLFELEHLLAHRYQSHLKNLLNAQ